jgi:hypothetical protein
MQIQQALAIVQLAPCDEPTKIHSAFSKIFWRYEFDFFEDFEIGLSAPLREGSFFALPLEKIDLDREGDELVFPGYEKTLDLAKEMQEELGGTSYHTLILEVVKATWNAKQNPPQTVEVEAIAIR